MEREPPACDPALMILRSILLPENTTVVPPHNRPGRDRVWVPPFEKGRSGGIRSFHHCCPDDLHHALDRLEHLQVVEADDPQTEPFQICCPFYIRGAVR